MWHPRIASEIVPEIDCAPVIRAPAKAPVDVPGIH
jgi:hypothetical protein